MDQDHGCDGEVSFPSPSCSCAAIHLSRKRARKIFLLLARLRERWIARQRETERDLLRGLTHGIQILIQMLKILKAHPTFIGLSLNCLV
jgi:hypothetical protein